MTKRDCGVKIGKESEVKEKNKKTAQEWISLQNIFEDGIVQTKENKFLKILKITPINYELKSKLEKEAILNSYKIFFNTCEFNTQILIQSRKEDLYNHIKNIQYKNKDEDEEIKKIMFNYIEYIKEINRKNKSSSKNFYIILEFLYPNVESNNFIPNEKEKQIITNNLNEKYYKVKECLSRTNNLCIELKKEEVIKIYFSFFNKRKEKK